MSWGIPLPAYGATLDDPDFYAAYPDVLPVLACFGISPEPNPYNIDIPEVTYKVADMIADDLLQRDDEWRQVGWLLKWLTSGTGNSSCDYDHETLSEFQPLSWDADDIAFAREIVEEADGIMADIHAGLAWINQHPAALEALQHNVRHVYKAVNWQKGRQCEPNMRLTWPEIHQPSEVTPHTFTRALTSAVTSIVPA